MKNKATSRGQKKPFNEGQVQLLRGSLTIAKKTMHLALLETAISTCLRASDLLSLTVVQVQTVNGIVDGLPLKQKKTQRVVLARFGARARAALHAWIAEAGLKGEQRLFKLSRQRYAEIVKHWATLVHADPRYYSTHSLRRTAPAHVYRKTHNAAAAARMLGHADLAETIAYLGIDVEAAHKLAEEHEL